MKVLVTGGTGAIGKFLLPLLAENKHEVVALTRSVTKAEQLGHTAVFELLGLGDGTRECYDFVFILDQQRQQEFADCPGATGDKDFHYAFVGLDGMRRGSPIDELRRPSANLTVNRYPRLRSNGLHNLAPPFGRPHARDPVEDASEARLVPDLIETRIPPNRLRRQVNRLTRLDRSSANHRFSLYRATIYRASLYRTALQIEERGVWPEGNEPT